MTKLDNFDQKLAKKLDMAMKRGSSKAAGFTVLAFGLSACGSDSGTTSSSSTSTTTTTTASTGTALTVSKSSAGTYSEAASVAGIALKSSASAAFAVADDTADSKYDITLDASGEGTLEFDFTNGDANDVVALSSGSKIAGFTTLKVVKGTLDVTALTDLGSISRVEINSGIKITYAQIQASITEIESTVGDAAVTITVETEAEARALNTLITSGSVSMTGVDTEALEITASPTATETISETLLSSIETAVSSTVAPVAPATPAAAPFDVGDTGTVEFLGTATGDISITWAGTAGASVATFTRGANTAETRVDFSSSKTVDLKTGQTINDAAADLNNVLVTGAGKVTTTASTGAQTLKVQTTAANELATGDGDDILEMGNSELLTAADVIDMGNGTGDTIKITADGDTTGAIFNSSSSNVENVTILAATATHAKLTLNNSAAETQAITIDATALTNTSAKFTLAIAGTAGNVDNALTVLGGADGDVITTGDGDDNIDGNAGADTVVAGAGDDTVTRDILTGVADAEDGGTGTDTLKLVGAIGNAGSASVAIDLRHGQTDQIAAVNTDFLTGNQTGFENFDVSGLTVTAAAGTNIVTFSNLNSTTDGTTTVLTGTAATTDLISDIADGTTMAAITNTAIEVIDMANGGVTLTMDAANFTGVTSLAGGSGTDVLVLGEAAAFDLSGVATYAAIETINMAASGAVATSVKIDQTGSNEFGGALTGAASTAQVLSLTDSGNDVIDITGITNTEITAISLVDDDDDLTIDVANLTDVTSISGVAAGNAETLILTGASTFDLSAVAISDLNIKGTDTDAQVLVSAASVLNIDFGGTGAGDTLKYTSSNQFGDAVTNFVPGSSKDVMHLQGAATYATSTAEGAKKSTLALLDTTTEIYNTTKHACLILTDTNLTSSAGLLTAFNASDVDETSGDLIVVWEDSDNGSGVVEVGVISNADTVDDDDVTYTTICTLVGVADTSAIVAANFDIIA
jgi:hypothetical protein